MAGRLSNTTMEAREALRREAARERAQKGPQGVIGTVGTAGQSMPIFRAQRVPNAHQGGGGVQTGTPQGLFGAPVKLEEEDETSRRLKNVLGDYKSIQGSPMAAGPPPITGASHAVHGHTLSQGAVAVGSSHQTSTAHSHNQSLQQQPHQQHSQLLQQQQQTTLATSQQEQQPQQTRRPQQANVPSSDSRSSARQSNGVASPGRQTALASKAAATGAASANQGTGPSLSSANPKPSFVSVAARKSHQSEQSGGALRGSASLNSSVTDQQTQHQGGLVLRSRPGSGGLSVPKNGGSNNRYSTPPDSAMLSTVSVNNLSSSGTTIPAPTGKELAVRLEEVLREMKIPPLLREIDDSNTDDRDRSQDPGWDRDAERTENQLHRTDGRDVSRPAEPSASLTSYNNAVQSSALPSGGPLRFTTLSSPQLAEMAAAGEIAPLLGLGGGRCGPLAGVEAPPDAHSPVRSPEPANGHAQNSLLSGSTGSLSMSQQQPQNLVASSVHSSTATRTNAAPAISEVDGGTHSGAVTGVANLSSPGSSSDSDDDDDDRESISQEESQDSDVEQNKSMRMTSFDTQFATTDKFPEKIVPFGDPAVGAPPQCGIFPQQQQQQQQQQHATAQLPSAQSGAMASGGAAGMQLSTESLPVSHAPSNPAGGDTLAVQTIESPNSNVSDDAPPDPEGGGTEVKDGIQNPSWSIASFMSAAPNSASSVSSVKSSAKSSPHRSPTPLEGTPRKSGKLQTQNRTIPAPEREHRKRKRQPSGSDARSKESSLEPPSSAEKRRSAPGSDQKQSGIASSQQHTALTSTAPVRGVVQQLGSHSARSSVTPEPDHSSNSSPLVKNNGGTSSMSNRRDNQIARRVVSPLIHHNTDSNSSTTDVADRRRERLVEAAAATTADTARGSGGRRKRDAISRDGVDEEDIGLVVKIPFCRLKRRPGSQTQAQQQVQPNAKCDSSCSNISSSGSGGRVGSANSDTIGTPVTATVAIPVGSGPKDDREADSRLDTSGKAATTVAAGGQSSQTNTSRSRDNHNDSSNNGGRGGSAKYSGSLTTGTQATPQQQSRGKERDDRSRADSPMSIDSTSSCCSSNVNANNNINTNNSNNNCSSNNMASSSSSSNSKNRRRPHGSDVDERGSRRKDEEKKKKDKKDKDKDKAKEKTEKATNKSAAADSNGSSSRTEKAEKAVEKSDSNNGSSHTAKEKGERDRDRSEKRDVAREEKRKDRERSKAEMKEEVRKDTAAKDEKGSSKIKSDDTPAVVKKEKDNTSSGPTKEGTTSSSKTGSDPSPVKTKEEKKDSTSATEATVKGKDDIKRKGNDESSRKLDAGGSSASSTSVAAAASSKEQPKDRWMKNKMLSDAAERMENESKITAPDWFIAEAKKLKHAGDKERTPSGQVKKYLESALCFMLSGNLIEVMPNRSDGSRQAQKMYLDTHALVRHVSTRLYKAALPSGGTGSQESRLIVLSLRVQAVLSHRIFVIMGRDRDFRDRSAAVLREFQSLNLAKLASNSESSGLSNGATASPAGSHSSASSGVLLAGGNTRDNGAPGSSQSAHGGGSQQTGRTYTLPAPLVESVQKTVNRLIHLERAYDLWHQSCNYMIETNNKEFFDAAASASCSNGHIDMFAPASEFVKFARETIFRIEELANVS
ncbi:uncharacterized protein LOC111248817 isoform X1 [Varroa destructor]|uniref:AF4/FMR2 family member lilli n=1 Tax=Varroa destructor TaxID=109461 RepID=A0A7M7K966_VARDE|nr:uncharacterized protein LOC111248817 isoform X1 [Varroa destructor]